MNSPWTKGSCILSVLLQLLLFATGCTRTIEKGSFKFLEIGMSKEEVVQSANAAGITDVRPTLENIISIRMAWGLGKLYDSPGIEVTDHKGFAISVSFEKDVVTDIDYSVPAEKFKGKYFSLGQSRKEAFDVIRKLMSDFFYLEVYNFLPKSRWVSLKTFNDDDMQYLEQYDAWAFHGSEEYSHYDLIFRNRVLAKIIYQWSPVDL